MTTELIPKPIIYAFSKVWDALPVISPKNSKQYGARTRARFGDLIHGLYLTNHGGHKSIAGMLNIAPRIVRTILIERGVYNPGSLKRLRVPWGERLGGIVKRIEKSHLDLARKWKASRPKKRKARKKAHPDMPVDLSSGERWMWLYRNSPQHRMKHLLRKRIRKVVTRGDRSDSTMQLLGCTIEVFIAHMESKFKKGMTWDNHGSGPGEWEIDHVIPCASFDLTQPAHQRRCFHYSNLQPLWSEHNRRKKDELPSKPHQWGLL